MGIGGKWELFGGIGCKQCDRLYQAERVNFGEKLGEMDGRRGIGGWLCSMVLKNFSEIKKKEDFF